MIGSGYGMGWGWLFGLLLLVGLVVLIVVAVRAPGGGVSGNAPTGDARPGDRSSRLEPVDHMVGVAGFELRQGASVGVHTDS